MIRATPCVPHILLLELLVSILQKHIITFSLHSGHLEIKRITVDSPYNKDDGSLRICSRYYIKSGLAEYNAPLKS